MDARRRRSRDRLRRAALDLATDHPPDALSVTEVAAAAGVHRSTFYEHAASPAELVEQALRAELDELRLDLLARLGEAGATRTEVGAAARKVTHAVLAHVERHAVVYRRGLGRGSGSSSLQSLLSEHFRESSRLLRQHHPAAFALPETGIAPGFADRVATALVADATVGAIETWLDAEPPVPRAEFLRLYDSLLPSWWPTSADRRAPQV